MSNRNILQALQSAGGAGGAGLDVDEVFSTHLYKGGTNSNTITNGLDLDGEGGLVWIKNRGSTQNNWLLSEDLGSNHPLSSNFNKGTSGNVSSYFGSSPLYTFNNNGFTTAAMSQLQTTNNKYVSWSFRKAKNFFDIVTYTGNGQTNRQISHNLGSVPGFMLVKRTDGIKDWAVYHRARGATEYGTLNTTEVFYDNNTWWQDTAPTSTNFTVGNSAFTNGNGQTYVAFIWAHHDQNGTFGPEANQDIIHCGSYDGNGSTTGPIISINTGFEPQWLLMKSNSESGSWFLFDVMRGIETGYKDAIQYAESAYADETGYEVLDVNSNGFQLKYGGSNLNGSNGSYIYVAIKRGSLFTPEDATKVFSANITTNSSNTHNLGFVPDMNINTPTTGSNNRYIIPRITGHKYLATESTAAETTISHGAFEMWDDNSGTIDLDAAWWGGTANIVSWTWKRAPGYFDVVCFNGTGNARNVTHNLGVAPEMIWIKGRSTADNWGVWHKGLSDNAYLMLNQYSGETTNANIFPATDPTASVFSVGQDGSVNDSNNPMIAYLFATCPGVSKVGSYTGNGTNQNIECGFSSGARFVLTKNINNSVGNWSVWDTARGLTASPNSYWIRLNGTNAHNNSYDWLEPYSGGFKVLYGGNANSPNNNGENYIFYAIA